MNASLQSCASLGRVIVSRLRPSPLWLGLWLCLLAFVGGNRAWAAPEAENAPPSAVTDLLGRHVTLKTPVRRIVSLSPSNTEVLFRLGLGDKVVGVTSFCNYPAEARKLPKIGGFAARTISVESVVALRPDLVLAGDETQKSVTDSLEKLGLACVAIRVRDFDELYSSVRLIGKLGGKQSEAESLVSSIRARVERVVQTAQKIPVERRVRVYWEVFDEPLMSAGPRSIVGQQIALAGGINIFADLKEEYPHISAEAVLARNPDVILGPRYMREKALTAERLAARPGWAQLSAVKNKRVNTLPDEPVSRPGPRLVDGLELLAAELYPEYFPDLPRAER